MAFDIAKVRAERRAAGLCIQCGAPRSTRSTWLCDTHLAQHRASEAEHAQQRDAFLAERRAKGSLTARLDWKVRKLEAQLQKLDDKIALLRTERAVIATTLQRVLITQELRHLGQAARKRARRLHLKTQKEQSSCAA